MKVLKGLTKIIAGLSLVAALDSCSPNLTPLNGTYNKQQSFDSYTDDLVQDPKEAQEVKDELADYIEKSTDTKVTIFPVDFYKVRVEQKEYDADDTVKFEFATKSITEVKVPYSQVVLDKDIPVIMKDAATGKLEDRARIVGNNSPNDKSCKALGTSNAGFQAGLMVYDQTDITDSTNVSNKSVAEKVGLEGSFGKNLSYEFGGIITKGFDNKSVLTSESIISDDFNDNIGRGVRTQRNITDTKESKQIVYVGLVPKIGVGPDWYVSGALGLNLGYELGEKVTIDNELFYTFQNPDLGDEIGEGVRPNNFDVETSFNVLASPYFRIGAGYKMVNLSIGLENINTKNQGVSVMATVGLGNYKKK